MKLQTKQREGSKVRRTYDQAQSPMQRLLASDAVPSNKQHELLRVTQALDPLRLLRQLEQLHGSYAKEASREIGQIEEKREAEKRKAEKRKAEKRKA